MIQHYWPTPRSCVDWCVSLVEYAREERRVNVGKSKVMGCSRYGNGGRMHFVTKRRTVRGSELF